MQRALFTAVGREGLGGLEVGGWPAWTDSECHSGVEARVGCLDLKTDSPRGPLGKMLPIQCGWGARE